MKIMPPGKPWSSEEAKAKGALGRLTRWGAKRPEVAPFDQSPAIDADQFLSASLNSVRIQWNLVRLHVEKQLGCGRINTPHVLGLVAIQRDLLAIERGLVGERGTEMSDFRRERQERLAARREGLPDPVLPGETIVQAGELPDPVPAAAGAVDAAGEDVAALGQDSAVDDGRDQDPGGAGPG